MTVKIETIYVEDAEKAAKELVKAQGKYRPIGSGAYGIVYGLGGSNVVYKVGELLTGEYDQDGYFEYVKLLCKQRSHNPYTPKIYGVRVYKSRKENRWGEKRNFYVVAMERLGRHVKWHEADAFEEIVGDIVGDESYDNAGSSELFGVRLIVPAALKRIISQIHAIVKKYDYSVDWDIHDGNIMLRGKHPVLIDPLA